MTSDEASTAERDPADDVALTFGFRFELPFAVPALLLGVRPQTASVSVRGDQFEARFGAWRVATPIGNVAGAEVTGPYWWPKVIGPPHLSFSDGGLTFATNRLQGVCVRFNDPVPGIAPFDLIKHGSLTVTVDGCAELAELLAHVGAVSPKSSIDVESVALETHDDLHSLTASQLRDRARERGLSGTGGMTKAELIDALEPDPEVGRVALGGSDLGSSRE